MGWIRDRALTLALMGMFLPFLAGQLLTGFHNSEQAQHGHTAVALTDLTLESSTRRTTAIRNGTADADE